MSVEKKKESMPKRERVVTLPHRGPASPLLSQQNPLPWRMEFDLTKGQGSHVLHAQPVHLGKWSTEARF